ncbi:hypothetical protein HY837_04570 [archaeon]|nr:hypothetical protein [archaeon]
MEKYAIIILLIVAIFGVAVLLLSPSLTGQSYRYAQNLGPQGQQSVHVNDIFFRIGQLASNQYPKKSSTSVCCSFVKLAEYDSQRCPSDRETFDMACAMDGEEGAYIYPPCPPNNLLCPIPGE